MSQFVSQKNVPVTSMEKGKGYEAFYSNSERMETTEYHSHDFYEFYLHIHGGQYFGIDSSLYRLEPYQLFIIPPFSMHGLSNIGELQNYERAYLNLSLETLKTLGCGQINLDGFFRSYTSRGLYTFQMTREDAQKCASQIIQLKNSDQMEDPVEQFKLCGILIDFLNSMCMGIRQSKQTTENVVSNSIIQDVLAYINTHYTQPLKIDQLAKTFGISVSYLSHEFARFTNRSVYEYILYRRVMLAQQLMQGEETLNGIAYQCGFNDYSNFLRIFNKIVGVSPSAYRKQLAKFSQSGQVS